MPLSSQQGESSVRSHAGGKIIVWENCWELCRKSKKVPQSSMLGGHAIWKKWRLELMFSFANRTLPQLQGSTSSECLFYWFFTSTSLDLSTGITQTSCRPHWAALPAGPQQGSDFQCDKWVLSVVLPVTGRYCQMDTSQVELSSLGL